MTSVSVSLTNEQPSEISHFFSVAIVFDDSVVYNCDSAGKIEMRMCVYHARFAMCCPACMADTECFSGNCALESIFESGDSAAGLC